MKTIQLSDKDYELLMELSAELQRQDNDFQAFPYFWQPISTRKVIGTEDDEPIIYDNVHVETYTFEEYFSENEDEFKRFLESVDEPENSSFDDVSFDDLKYWVECQSGIDIVYQKEKQIPEQNFSIFKSDVKKHIESNGHHLGKNPHTYARTIWRMPKMEALVRILYRLNPLPEKEINQEALAHTRTL